MRQGSVLSVLPGRSLHVLLLERRQAATHAPRSSLQSLHPPSSLLLFLSLGKVAIPPQQWFSVRAC